MDSSSSQPVKYLIPEGSSEDCPFLGRFEEEKEKQKEVGNEKQKLDEDSKNSKGEKRIFSAKIWVLLTPKDLGAYSQNFIFFIAYEWAQ